MPKITSAPSGHHYVRSLDGVRAASILLVIAAHTAPVGLPEWGLNQVAGRAGMALFFCLSGYLITSILYRDQNIASFLTKRLCRIVPAVYLYLTVLLLFGLPFDAYIVHLMFLGNYLTWALDTGPVSHLWSLCVEVHFYMVIALLVVVLGRRSLWLIPPAALIVTAFRIEAGAMVNINTHLRVDEILAGGTLALVSLRWGGTLRGFLTPRPGLVLLIFFSVLLFFTAHEMGGPLLYLRPYAAMMLVGTIMHCRLPVLHDILEGRIAGYVARISYALYIWHPAMIAGAMNSGSLAERYLIKRPFSWAATWLAAHLSTVHWEAAWQRFARRRVAKWSDEASGVQSGRSA